jgi:hypothetical protein
MSVGIHWGFIEQGFGYLGYIEFAKRHNSDGFAEPHADHISQQRQGNHLFEQGLFLVHELGQMQQVFTIFECLFDFHPLKIDLQATFGFQAGDDPQGFGQAIAPVADQIDLDRAQVVDIGANDRLARLDD